MAAKQVAMQAKYGKLTQLEFVEGALEVDFTR